MARWRALAGDALRLRPCVEGAVGLLEPVYEAQLASILRGHTLAMDETPIRAGRKAKGKGIGRRGCDFGSTSDNG